MRTPRNGFFTPLPSERPERSGPAFPRPCGHCGALFEPCYPGHSFCTTACGLDYTAERRKAA